MNYDAILLINSVLRHAILCTRQDDMMYYDVEAGWFKGTYHVRECIAIGHVKVVWNIGRIGRSPTAIEFKKLCQQYENILT
jgi:hypothetical protein